jgi:hypothetical protein
MRRVAVLPSLIVAALVGANGRVEPETTSTSPILTGLQSRLRPVLQRYYPQAKSQVRGEVLQFEQDTRVFLIHIPLKTGEWQEAREVKGPNQGGILCTIELRNGRYDGAAVLPQTFNDRYFETLVMAEASPDQSRYLYVHLSYPHGVERRFLGEFHEVVRSAWKERP